MEREFQIAWLAGLIDGDGCFSIEERKAYLRIVLQERDKFVLERVQEIAGGRLNLRPRPPSARQAQKTQWVWTLARREKLASLCGELLPFLVLKKKRCEEVVDHLALLQGVK